MSLRTVETESFLPPSNIANKASPFSLNWGLFNAVTDNLEEGFVVRELNKYLRSILYNFNMSQRCILYNFNISHRCILYNFISLLIDYNQNKYCLFKITTELCHCTDTDLLRIPEVWERPVCHLVLSSITSVGRKSSRDQFCPLISIIHSLLEFLGVRNIYIFI